MCDRMHRRVAVGWLALGRQQAGGHAACMGSVQLLTRACSPFRGLYRNIGCELVASGALDAALDWAGRPEGLEDGALVRPQDRLCFHQTCAALGAALSMQGMCVAGRAGCVTCSIATALHCTRTCPCLHSACPPTRLQTFRLMRGVHKAALAAAVGLAPLPAQRAPPASAAALLAAAVQHVQQQLGLSGEPARSVARLVAIDAASHSALPAAQRRAFMVQISRPGQQMWANASPTEARAWAAALLEQVKPVAERHIAVGSPAALDLALERCYAVGQRRCAHLGCTNVPLLLGAGAGGSQQPARSRKCTGCSAVRFCSEACSRADWRVHKQACRQIAAEAAEAAVEAAAEAAEEAAAAAAAAEAAAESQHIERQGEA